MGRPAKPYKELDKKETAKAMTEAKREAGKRKRNEEVEIDEPGFIDDNDMSSSGDLHDIEHTKNDDSCNCKGCDICKMLHKLENNTEEIKDIVSKILERLDNGDTDSDEE